MNYTVLNLDESEAPEWSSVRHRSYWKLYLAGIFVVLVLCLLRWGGYLLVARNTLPNHVDAAIVLRGSTNNEKARMDAGMALLHEDFTGRVALSVPKESFWGEEIAPVARQYVEIVKKTREELAGR